MPKIVSYTPAWLSSPAPGHEVFSPSTSKASSDHASAKRNARPGPRRTIARRGTEIFVARGKEIRWADLVNLSDAFEEEQGLGKNTDKEDDANAPRPYRVSQPT